MTTHRYADWDAAYVLGALSSADRREFEDHLATCPPCRDALAELAGMPGLLGAVSSVEVLALVEEEQDRALERPVLQDRRNFQQGGDDGAVVGCSRPDGGAVVMSIEQQRPSRRWSDRCNDIANAGARYATLLVQLVAGELVADDGVEAHLAQQGHDPLANLGICFRVARVRTLIAEYEGEARLGPTRVELTCAIVFAKRRRLDQQ